MFLFICPPSLLVPLPHFLTLVFSSSPFFRLPQSQEFAAGQKAAAEAQPIWNEAPPSWRSERERGTRLVVNQAAKSTSCLYAQPTHPACLDLLDCSSQHTPVLLSVCELWNMHEWVNRACQFEIWRLFSLLKEHSPGFYSSFFFFVKV